MLSRPTMRHEPVQVADLVDRHRRDLQPDAGAAAARWAPPGPDASVGPRSARLRLDEVATTSARRKVAVIMRR